MCFRILLSERERERVRKNDAQTRQCLSLRLFRMVLVWSSAVLKGLTTTTISHSGRCCGCGVPICHLQPPLHRWLVLLAADESLLSSREELNRCAPWATKFGVNHIAASTDKHYVIDIGHRSFSSGERSSDEIYDDRLSQISNNNNATSLYFEDLPQPATD